MKTMARSLAPLALTIAAAACGGAATPATPLSSSAPSAPATDAAPALPPGTRVASAELQALARPAGPATDAAYADLEGLARSDFGRALVPALLDGKNGGDVGALHECAGRILANGRELALGGDGGDVRSPVVTIRMSPGSAHDTLTACAKTLSGPAIATTETGADEVLADDAQAVARRGDVLVFGARRSVKDVLVAPPVPWPSELSLPPRTFVVFVDSGHRDKARGSLALDEHQLLASLQITAPNEDAARKEEKDLESLLAFDFGDEYFAGLDPSVKTIVARVRQSAHVTRKPEQATTLTLALQLDETPAEQARDVAAVGRLAENAVRLLREGMKEAEADFGKKMEAERMLEQIAQAYERRRTAGAPTSSLAAISTETARRRRSSGTSSSTPRPAR